VSEPEKNPDKANGEGVVSSERAENFTFRTSRYSHVVWREGHFHFFFLLLLLFSPTSTKPRRLRN